MTDPPLDPASVLGKAMRVLEAFAPDDTGVGFAELQRRTGLPKATLHRVAGDLVAARLLTAFRTWKMLEPRRRAEAEKALRRVAGTPGLSPDVADISGRSLS